MGSDPLSAINGLNLPSSTYLLKPSFHAASVDCWLLTRWRRLVRDYEARLDVSKAMIHVAMGSLPLRRITLNETSQTDS